MTKFGVRRSVVNRHVYVFSRSQRSLLKVKFTPFIQTIEAVTSLLAVRPCSTLQPFLELVYVSIKKQKFPENLFRSVETFLGQPSPQNWSDSRKICDGLALYRLPHEVPVLFWCGTHNLLRNCRKPKRGRGSAFECFYSNNQIVKPVKVRPIITNQAAHD